MKWIERKFNQFIYSRQVYNLKQNVSFLLLDSWTLIIIFIVFVLNILIFFPRPIPFHIPSLIVQRQVIDSILKFISIFFGLTFSFIVLSFNIFYRHFGRYVFIAFFKNKNIRRPFTLLLATICLLIYSTSFLNNSTVSSAYSNNLYFISIALSIVSFFLLFPSVITLLKKSQSRKNINEIISTFDAELDREELEEKYFGIDHDNSYKKPGVLLKEIGTVAVREYDSITLLYILTGTRNYFKACSLVQDLEQRKEKLSVYNIMTSIYLELFAISVKERNSSAAIDIVNARFELELYILTNLDKIPYRDINNEYHFWQLWYDVERYFNKCMTFNEDDVAKSIIEEWREFLVRAMSILIPAGYSCANSMTCNMELGAITGGFSNIVKLNEIIQHYNKGALYKSISNTFNTISLTIINYEITNAGKDGLLTILGNCEFQCFEKFAKNKDTYSIAYLEQPFSNSVNAAADCNHAYSFSLYLKTTTLLMHLNVLNNLYLYGLKAKILEAMRKVNEKPQLTPLVILGIKQFDRLRKAVKQDDSDYRKEIYVKLEDYLRILKNALLEYNITNQEIVNLLDTTLSSFTNTTQFKVELNDKGHVFDETFI